MNLCVLASDSKEVSDLAVRLNDPSKELRGMLSERLQLPRTDGFSEVLDFRVVGNLSTIEAAARTFKLTIEDRFRGGLAFHLVEISTEFPGATFLPETVGTTFSRKQVLREGRWVQELQGSDRANKATGFGILDIFAPFRAEYSAKLAFGSLWETWLDETGGALQQLKSDSNSASESLKPPRRRSHSETKLSVSLLTESSDGDIKRRLNKISEPKQGGNQANPKECSRRKRLRGNEKGARSTRKTMWKVS